MRIAAEALETGRFDGPLARLLASVWAPWAARGLVRPGRVPRDVPVVGVGGATLGGSGKTPLVIACARELARMHRVAVVGHAYRARPGRARVVVPGDLLAEVGDEALVCAAAVPDALVVVAGTRQEAIDHALGLAPDVLVIDGALRLSDAPRMLSLLAVDAIAPWGSGQLPPAGDLRAAPGDLRGCADHVVEIGGSIRIRWSSPPGPRVGLFTALARPDRIRRALAIDLAAVITCPDHGPPPRDLEVRLAAADSWVASEKCALHLRGTSVTPGILHSEVVLPLSVLSALRDLTRETRGFVGLRRT